jgi:hypothetical protein
MVTNLSYSMTCNEDGCVATCVELTVKGCGSSPLDAIWALRMAIEESVADWYTLERHLPAQELPRTSDATLAIQPPLATALVAA